MKLVSVVGKDAAGSALLRLWDNHNDRSTIGILVNSSSRTATVSTVMVGKEIYAGIADTGELNLASPFRLAAPFPEISKQQRSTSLCLC